jgi:hypothetical protein
MRLAILYDGESLASWQKRALDTLGDEHELHFLIAHDVRPSPRSPVRHALYYALNLLAIRNVQTRRVAFKVPAGEAPSLAFVPAYEGNWAALPQHVQEWIRTKKIDAIVKFGLGLLRIPDQCPPVLSWHHGDPARYRGRPAGFHELVRAEPFVGQIVQRLTNALDAGEVLAFTESRVHRHSYRKTLIEAYALSPFLLRPALDALRQDERLPHDCTGPVYRLPSNAAVVKFVIRAAAALVRHLLYGAFVEKRWQVSTCTGPPSASPGKELVRIERERATWSTRRPPPGFTFLADPFFGSSADEILAEALEARTGKGRLVRFVGTEPEVLRTAMTCHLSYPGTLVEGGIRHVVPEMAQGGRQGVFTIENGELRLCGRLDIDAGSLLDPTLMARDGNVYLFANLSSEGPAILRLWSAPTLLGRFTEHPASPIRISARGSRMAGEIVPVDRRLLRIGQDSRRSYGTGILAFVIEELTPTRYREKLVDEGAFEAAKGPHTLNFRDGVMVFDWYEERFSVLAGARRLLSRL